MTTTLSICSAPESKKVPELLCAPAEIKPQLGLIWRPRITVWEFTVFQVYGIDAHLSVLADAVTQRHQTALELVGRKAAGAVLVKVVEACSKLVELLASDALRVSGQNLVLHFVDVSIDRCQQLFPSYSQGLHCELCVPEIYHIQC